MANLKDTLKSRVISMITLLTLFIALSSSGALGGFWRAIYPSFQAPGDSQDFKYGYGYGTFGWGYGYGYGYGYGNTYDDGYYYDTPTTPTTSSPSSSSPGGGGGGGLAKDYCPNGDNSGSYYDGKCTSGSTSTGTTTTTTSTETTTSTKNVKDKKPFKPFVDDVKITKDSKTGKVTITKDDGTKVTFSDISNTFATKYIVKLAAAGIINGYPDGTFRPENKASRAEYLKMVLRAVNVDYSLADTSKLTFSDVDKNSWVAKVVAKAAELKLIDTKNKNFRPDARISRAEAMKMLLNAAGIQVDEKATSSFADVSGWAVKYIEKAKELGIVNGQEIKGKVLFRPADNITRAEVSKIVVRTMELK